MRPDSPACAITSVFDESSGYACLRLDFVQQTDDVGIIFLHGVGERGGDSRQILKYGLPSTLWSESHDINCQVVCPHLPAEEVWDAARLARLIAAQRERTRRVLVCGYSLGAAGACALLAQEVDPPDIAIIIAARFREPTHRSRVSATIIFVEGELDDWADTYVFRESLSREGVPFLHVVIPHAGHFIAEAALESEAVTSAFQSLGIHYRRRELG